MSDHTYIVELCDKSFELDNSLSNSRCDENNENDIGNFIDTLDELIITCVQSYPHLYNKADKNYKDNIMKEKSWEEIATTCNISVTEVQQRWKRIDIANKED
ncbi:Transcription factor Adf-1 [Camponotus japonicus]